ncbi:type II toxin-antitoxin system RelB/DinJ family antitoxin [Olsenella sp. YH-ols2217]|uniref:Type II toxin-antitoxin system RelB/DinJ family antitoxin n=1 Tax=Kribbibacterium absianum TaxID=3044210 RepID=A0ABT6ZLT9_9ACTN|nr:MULTISPECIES: type II toxin-antitoxin system RelB/DinJ family antitoxin [unclassified Olsenella]MDJ1121751.1 type II toxin-antitoxin system RelB/DinJ family antitoxin [Olsenella sp. YH-ols2216]MDJ1129759.1 type II toxin-antitoxin system RelB/DinJ family antitoxin [Olsenella sp. YH-ols2217]
MPTATVERPSKPRSANPATAMITARMTPEKKEEGNAALKALGVTPSEAVNQLYDYVIRCGDLPFEPEEKVWPSQLLTDEEKRRRLEEAKARLEKIAASLPPYDPANDPFLYASNGDIARARAEQRLAEGKC